jgi:carbon-monoxide dehydrogenase small subunit
MTVNGAPVSGEVEGRTLLVEFLRDQPAPDGHPCGLRHQPVRRLRGACGRLPVKACTALALDVAGAEVVTIEGLAAPDGTLSARCRRRFGSITGCNAASARRG